MQTPPPSSPDEPAQAAEPAEPEEQPDIPAQKFPVGDETLEQKVKAAQQPTAPTTPKSAGSAAKGATGAEPPPPPADTPRSYSVGTGQLNADIRAAVKKHDAAIKDLNTQMQNKQAGIDASWQKDLAGFQALNEQYRQHAAERDTRTAWAEVGETLGHALAQLGAGMQGQRSGVDAVTGLKFDKTDWSKRYAQTLAELRTNLEDVRAQQQGREREKGRQEMGLERERATGERAADRELSSSERAAETGQRSREADAERQFRMKEGELNRKSREGIAELRDSLKALKLGQDADEKARKKAEEVKGQLTQSLRDMDSDDPALKKKGKQAWDRAAAAGRAYFGNEAIDSLQEQLEGSWVPFSGDAAGAAASAEGLTPKRPPGQKAGQFPRQVVNAKTGKQATVKDAQELAEAQAEGFN